MEGTFGWFSWVVSVGVAAWMIVDAKRRRDDRWGLWAFLGFMFPWVAGPAYWYFFIRQAPGALPGHGAAPARGKGKGKDRGQIGRPAGDQGKDQDEAIARMAEEIAGAANAAARADLIRMIGREWADAVAAETKPGGLATVRVLVESAAEATARGDVAKAQEQMDKALSHVRGGARRHPGGRMILAGLAAFAANPRPDRAKATPIAPISRAEREARTGELAPPPPPAPPAPPPPAPSPSSSSTDAVPAFIAARQPAAPSAASAVPPTPAPTLVPAAGTAQEARDEAEAVGAREPAPPARPRPSDAEPLDAYAARVTALSTQWLAAVVDRAPGLDRSYARVRLESAASAVFRGDFDRACEMADAAAALVPADVPAARQLRSDLRASLESR